MNYNKNKIPNPTYHTTLNRTLHLKEYPSKRPQNLINDMKISKEGIEEIIETYKKLINNKTSSYINNISVNNVSKKSIEQISNHTIELLDELLVNKKLSNNEKIKKSTENYETFKEILKTKQEHNNNYKGGKRKNKRKSTKKDKRLGKYKHNGHTHKTKQAMKKCTK